MAGSGCAWGAEPPRFLEAFGRLWQVQSRLGSGSSASVYRVRCCGTPGSPPGALKQFLPPGTTGAAASVAEQGFRKERAALEQLQGHRNIGRTSTYSSSVFSGEKQRTAMTFQTEKTHQPAPLERKKTRQKAVSMPHQRDISKAAVPLGAFLAKEVFCDKWNLSFYVSASALTNGNPMPSSEYHCLKLVPRRKEEGKEEFSHGKAFPI